MKKSATSHPSVPSISKSGTLTVTQSSQQTITSESQSSKTSISDESRNREIQKQLGEIKILMGL
jgi:hypothetical protein